jgi:hypothetical protein
MDAVRYAIALFVLSGCLGVTPDERLREEIGDGEEDDGPEHNPGEPCLACHSQRYSPGEDVFAFAGTVYLEQGDTEGIAGARVFVEDARGRTIEAVSNRAGNFMVEVEDGDDDGTRIDEEEGKTKIGFWPEYPLTVRVTYGDLEQEMLNPIRREGSCSACHYQEPDADSVGRIYMVDPP